MCARELPSPSCLPETGKGPDPLSGSSPLPVSGWRDLNPRPLRPEAIQTQVLIDSALPVTCSDSSRTSADVRARISWLSRRTLRRAGSLAFILQQRPPVSRPRRPSRTVPIPPPRTTETRHRSSTYSLPIRLLPHWPNLGLSSGAARHLASKGRTLQRGR